MCENVSLRACTQIDNAYNVRCIGLLDAITIFYFSELCNLNHVDKYAANNKVSATSIAGAQYGAHHEL